MSKFIRRPASIMLGVVVSATLLAACATSGSPGGGGSPSDGGASVPESTAAAGTDASPAAPATAASGALIGHVGDKLTFTELLDGTPVDATLVKVFDPAAPTDASEAPLPPKTHWVGVEIVLDNHSSDFGTEGSEVDATTSAGARVTTTDAFQGGSYVLGDGFHGCTQTSGSEHDVQPYTHCWAFVVPDGQTLAKVGVKVGGMEIDSSSVPTDQASWTVP